jgi:hypothetical protein
MRVRGKDRQGCGVRKKQCGKGVGQPSRLRDEKEWIGEAGSGSGADKADAEPARDRPI